MLYSPAPRPCFSEVTIWKTQLERLRVSEFTQYFHVRSEDAEKKAREAEHLETTLRVRRADPCTCARPGLHRPDPGASQTLMLNLLPGEHGVPGEDSQIRCMFCSAS